MEPEDQPTEPGVDLQLRAKKEPPLDEKDFIQQGPRKNPLPLWLFITIVLGIAALFWTGGQWVVEQIQTRARINPFLQVTNRKISLFLWQNPEYMRVHAAEKTGYLEGFHTMGRVNPKVETAGQYVTAPPEVLFLYHTWHRLLGDYVMPRPIPKSEFQEFLSSSPEWLPDNWVKAPEEYRQFVKELGILNTANLQNLTKEVFPIEVRNAFLGWKNYYREGDLINNTRPTVKEMHDFIERYPHYSRNYWRNLYPNYLKTLQNSSADPESVIPSDELAPFLRSAYYNYSRAGRETLLLEKEEG